MQDIVQGFPLAISVYLNVVRSEGAELIDSVLDVVRKEAEGGKQAVTSVRGMSRTLASLSKLLGQSPVHFRG